MVKSLFDLPQLDAQLADMDSHREKAVAAVGKGNSVLQDAANTLRTLKGSITIFLGFGHIFKYSNLQWPSAIFVEYFDQRLGAAHSNSWPKSAVNHVFHMFS